MRDEMDFDLVMRWNLALDQFAPEFDGGSNPVWIEG